METAYEFLKESGVFFIATVADGKPRVRPIGFVMTLNDRLYFCTGKKKEVYFNLLKEPEIEICAVSKDRTKWLRLRGRVRFDESKEAKKKVFELAPHLLKIYPKGEEDENFVTFFIEDSEARLFSLKGEVEQLPLI